MSNYSDLTLVGIIGFTNISLLTIITLLRTIRYITTISPESKTTRAYYKKVSFHLCLLGATLSDLPMYGGFIIVGDYTLISYSFHRFESAFLFAAISLTISDWSSLLYQIQEYKLYLFLFGRATLVSINAIYTAISIINFVFCYALDNLDVYLNSPVYLVCLIFQLLTSFLLTVFMLFAGLKLSWRIKGAAGDFDSSNHMLANRANNALNQPNGRTISVVKKKGQDFSNALRTLNLVMVICTACSTLQVILLSLDYGLGYASETDVYVGPELFYWTCYFWIPLWGPTLSLLYLSRTHTKSNRTASYSDKHSRVKEPSTASSEFERFSSLTGTVMSNSIVYHDQLAHFHGANPSYYGESIRETDGLISYRHEPSYQYSDDPVQPVPPFESPATLHAKLLEQYANSAGDGVTSPMHTPANENHVFIQYPSKFWDTLMKSTSFSSKPVTNQNTPMMDSSTIENSSEGNRIPLKNPVKSQSSIPNGRTIQQKPDENMERLAHRSRGTHHDYVEGLSSEDNQLVNRMSVISSSTMGKSTDEIYSPDNSLSINFDTGAGVIGNIGIYTAYSAASANPYPTINLQPGINIQSISVSGSGTIVHKDGIIPSSTSNDATQLQVSHVESESTTNSSNTLRPSFARNQLSRAHSDHIYPTSLTNSFISRNSKDTINTGPSFAAPSMDSE